MKFHAFLVWFLLVHAMNCEPMPTISKTETQKAASPSAAAKPPMPREHGAWGMLLIPFATAAGAAGMFDMKLALLLTSVLSLYIARTSFLKHNWKWMWLLLGFAAANGIPLLLVWNLWWLAAFAVVGAALAFRRTDRSTMGELVAAGGLALTAPAAWYAARGELDRTAFWLWALNTAYFAGGVLYVKMWIRAALKRRPLESFGERIQTAAAALLYHGALAILLVAASVTGTLHAAVAAAFAPMMIRAAAGFWRLSHKLQIRQLGWLEVAYSVVFAVLLIAAIRWVGGV